MTQGPRFNPDTGFKISFAQDELAKVRGKKKAPVLRRNRSWNGVVRSEAPTDVDDRGWTSLHVASLQGDTVEVMRLLSYGWDANIPSQGPKAPGATPLHLAASGGHVEVMDALLEHGANIEARTKGGCGWTPLHYAAKAKSRRATRFLVENGAFLAEDMEDLRFNPPLHYCPGLEYAYKVHKRMLSPGCGSTGSPDSDSI